MKYSHGEAELETRSGFLKPTLAVLRFSRLAMIFAACLIFCAASALSSNEQFNDGTAESYSCLLRVAANSSFAASTHSMELCSHLAGMTVGQSPPMCNDGEMPIQNEINIPNIQLATLSVRPSGEKDCST